MTSVDKPQQHPAPEGVAAPFTIAVDHQVDGNHLALTASPWPVPILANASDD